MSEATWRIEVIDIPTRELAEQVAESLNFLTDLPNEPRIRIRLLRVEPEPVSVKTMVDAALERKLS